MSTPDHAAVVAPEEMVKAGGAWQVTFDGETKVPVLYNVGTDNGKIALDHSWRPNKNNKPVAHILNKDKEAIVRSVRNTRHLGRPSSEEQTRSTRSHWLVWS